MKRFPYFILSCVIILHYSSQPSSAADTAPKVFKTKYAAVHYLNDKDMDDFIWRLGGQRLELPADAGLASYRIDRLVERVEAILDMRPKNFQINIYLHRGFLELQRIAYYDYKTKSIHISVDYASDGVAAHEMAHAVINHHFSTPLPSKIQEILTQYVDKYLWSDY